MLTRPLVKKPILPPKPLPSMTTTSDLLQVAEAFLLATLGPNPAMKAISSDITQSTTAHSPEYSSMNSVQLLPYPGLPSIPHPPHTGRSQFMDTEGPRNHANQSKNSPSKLSGQSEWSGFPQTTKQNLDSRKNKKYSISRAGPVAYQEELRSAHKNFSMLHQVVERFEFSVDESPPLEICASCGKQRYVIFPRIYPRTTGGVGMCGRGSSGA